MSTVHSNGVRFRIYPQDHDPVHAHGRYAETVVVVELIDGAVAIAARADAILPADAKRNDVKKILKEATAAYAEIVARWKEMQA